MSKKSLTLIELLMVLIVVGLVAGFVIPNFARARLNAIDREAQSMLVLIRAAQQARVAEGRDYANCDGAAACNDTFDNGGLGLDLPVGGHWTYTTVSASANTAFCVEATGGPSGNTFCITQGIWEAAQQNCGTAPCN